MLRVTKASDGRSYMRVVIGLNGFGKFWCKVNVDGITVSLFRTNLSSDEMVISPVPSRV
ncbi:MAG: hypothetical protein VYC61_02435 [Candidatus Neomarinimicrobiota bacterium]|nr:hypothetical protein [Candidatus Neomarinimicrobiota bacterium]